MRIGCYKYLECTSQDGQGITHGHLYKVELVVEGPLKGGIVIDFTILKNSLVKALGTYASKSLNDIFEQATPENLCLQLFKDIQKVHPGLEALRLWEGDDMSLEINRDEAGKVDAPLLVGAQA